MPFPLEAPAFGDRSENVPGTARPDSYRTLRRVGSAVAGIAPLEPNEKVPAPERASPLGIFSGEPMSFVPFPLPLGGLSDNSDRPGGGNLFDFLAGLAPRNPSPTPPPTSVGGIPVRALRRSTAGQPQDSVFDTGAPARAARSVRECKSLGRSPRKAHCFGWYRSEKSDTACAVAR